MTEPKTRKTKAQSDPSGVSIVVRVDLGPAGHIGPGKIALLERIDELGSISAAGRSMGMSYRQAWELVDQLYTVFSERVATQHAGGRSGGGATLTEFGKALVARYRAISETASTTAAIHIDALSSSLKKTGETGGE